MAIPRLYFLLECTGCGGRQVVHDTYLQYTGTSSRTPGPGEGYGGPPLPERYRCLRRCRAPLRAVGSIWKPGDREMWTVEPHECVELSDEQVAEWARLIRAPRRHGRAWLLLTCAIALFVVDAAVREGFAFAHAIVLALAIALASFTPWVRRGKPGALAASWVLSATMLVSGIAHLAASAYFGRWLPGSTTAPVSIAASAGLAYAARERVRGPGRIRFDPPPRPARPDCLYEPLGTHARGPLIALTMSGTYPSGSDGNDFARAMREYAQRIIRGTRPAGVVFDFRSLRYEWGDGIAALAMTLQDGDRFRPAAIVATGRTADALTGLIAPNMLFGIAAVQLVASRDEAIAAVTAMLDREP